VAGDTWTLGDLLVRRVGFGAMRLPQRGTVFAADAVPRDRDQAIKVRHRGSRTCGPPHRGPHVLVIPGTGDLDHLADNVAAGALRLTPEDLARLEVVHQAAAAST
jgi:hypothetical protein